MQNQKVRVAIAASFCCAFAACQSLSSLFSGGVITNPNFPPRGGIPDPMVAKFEQCDRNTDATAYYWKASNATNKTITFLLQTEGDKLPEAHPIWKQITLGPNQEYKIPQCDKIHDANQTFTFSVTGTNLGNEPMWPMPNGNRSKDMPILIHNGNQTLYLANRHATRRLRVRYQIENQPEQSVNLEPREFAPISSSKNAKIIDANYI